MPWILLIPFYVIYESAINIYYFYNQYNHGFPASSPLSVGQGGVITLLYFGSLDLRTIDQRVVVISSYLRHDRPASQRWRHGFQRGCVWKDEDIWRVSATTLFGLSHSTKSRVGELKYIAIRSKSLVAKLAFIFQRAHLPTMPNLYRHNLYISISYLDITN